jgi:hypothetical protein
VVQLLKSLLFGGDTRVPANQLKSLFGKKGAFPRLENSDLKEVFFINEINTLRESIS